MVIHCSFEYSPKEGVKPGLVALAAIWQRPMTSHCGDSIRYSIDVPIFNPQAAGQAAPAVAR
jgi:hypothetical protein